MKPDTVCFDLGGVLVRIRTDWNDLLGREGTEHPWAIDEPAIFAQFQAGEVVSDRYLSEVSKLFGISPSEAALAHDKILIEPYPGTLELILDLEAHGISTGCLSNTNEMHWQAMLETDRFPAVSRLQHKVASHLVGASKPDLGAFVAFEKECGKAPPQILYFDDSATHVTSAAQRGWHSHLVDPSGDTAQQMRVVLQTFGLL